MAECSGGLIERTGGRTEEMEAQEQLKQWISESSRIVFFGGAGISTESGIPDFRGVDGLYHQQ